MENRFLRIGSIVAGCILVVVIGLSLVVKSYLKSDRLKALIIPRIEEFTGRKADVARIDVSLFRGITVRELSLMGPDGRQEFLKVKEFVLEYRLFPLLQKRLVIKKVDLISPSVFLFMGRDGRLNFSDILKKRKKEKRGVEPGNEEKGGLPLSIETDRISVRDAKISFRSEEPGQPEIDGISDMDLSLSVKRGEAPPEVSGKVRIKELVIKGKGGEIKSSGILSIGSDDIEFNISANVEKDTIKVSGDVKDFRNKPVVRADVTSSELNAEKIMGFAGGEKDALNPKPVRRVISAGKEKGTPREEKTKEARTDGLTASGEVKVGSLKYKGYVLKDFAAGYKYSGGNLVIDPIDAGVAGEKGFTLQGTVKGALRGSTSVSARAADSLKSSLAGSFTVDLSRCELKESKIGGAIALFTGIKELASPKFDTVHFAFTVGNEKIVLNGNMISSVMTLNPSGTIGFDTAMDVTADLRVAPGIAGNLVSGKYMNYVKDEKGWTVLPLRITGTTDKPSVGINQAAVGRQLRKGVTQEIEKRLFKGIFGK